MTDLVFHATSYINYISSALKHRSQSRGQQAELARFLGCQTSFISQVLTGRAHLSREQSIKVTTYFEHSADERRFFMLLVDRERAGTEQLRTFYEQEMEAILRRREEVRERIAVVDQVPDEAHFTYYDSWVYAAIHVLSALPSTKTAEAIARHLRMPLERITPVVDWLLRQGLVAEQDGQLTIGRGRVHLGSNSPSVGRHHANWRIKALEYVDRPGLEDLHYSAVLGISRAATAQLKRWLLEFLERSEPVIRAAPEERATVLLLDLFEL